MDSELKESLVKMVEASTEVLSDDDAMEIVQVCKRAADRAIADAAERYMVESLNGGDCE